MVFRRNACMQRQAQGRQMVAALDVSEAHASQFAGPFWTRFTVMSRCNKLSCSSSPISSAVQIQRKLHTTSMGPHGLHALLCALVNLLVFALCFLACMHCSTVGHCVLDRAHGWCSSECAFSHQEHACYAVYMRASVNTEQRVASIQCCMPHVGGLPDLCVCAHVGAQLAPAGPHPGVCAWLAHPRLLQQHPG